LISQNNGRVVGIFSLSQQKRAKMSSYVSGQSSGYCVVPIDDACTLAEAARTEGVDYTYAFYQVFFFGSLLCVVRSFFRCSLLPKSFVYFYFSKQVGTRSEAVKKNKLMVLISRKTNACFDDPDVCRKKLVNFCFSSSFFPFLTSSSSFSSFHKNFDLPTKNLLFQFPKWFLVGFGTRRRC